MLANNTLWRAHKAATLKMLKKWTNEELVVRTIDGEHVLIMSLMGSAMLGMVVLNVQLLAWTEAEKGRLYWLSRRSARKNFYTGKLDITAESNFAAGE